MVSFEKNITMENPYTNTANLQLNSIQSANLLADLAKFQPQDRQSYLSHQQAIYNLKLHTDFPLVLHIEPTSFCNQKCIMCCHPTQKRTPTYINRQLVIKALEEASKFQPWSTNFFFFGEPFLNQDLIEYFGIAKFKYGLRNVSTTTNLTAIRKDQMDQLFDSGLDSIHISYEGADEETYNHVRGVKTFKIAYNNLKYLIAEKKRRNSPLWIALTYVRTTESDEKISKFQNDWSEQVDDIHISPQIEYRNGSEDGARRQKIATWQDDRNTAGFMENDSKSRVPCRQLWNKLVVTADGKLVPCTQNIDGELSLGNLNDCSIHEAWTGKAMQELRSEHLSNNFCSSRGLTCEGCTDWDWAGKTDERADKLQLKLEQ